MLKSIARKELLEKRKLLADSDCLKMDDLLLIQLQKMDWSAIEYIGNFFPNEAQSEPNSLLLVKYLKYLIPNCTIAYPKINAADFSMDFYEETDQIQPNQWGIQEPLPTHIIDPIKLDAILVPLIGFDLIGQRIGFGKGFYDRYFARCTTTTKRIGISYFDPLPIIEDTHQFDVPLTHCITPWKLYEF